MTINVLLKATIGFGQVLGIAGRMLQRDEAGAPMDNGQPQANVRLKSGIVEEPRDRDRARLRASAEYRCQAGEGVRWWPAYSVNAADSAHARPRTSCTSSPTAISPPSITKQLSASLPAKRR
jgi:hypothetical protein